MGEEYTRRVTVVGSLPVEGSLIFHDDFESTFRWASAAEGNGAATKSATRSRSKANSMKLTTDSGTPASGQTCEGKIQLALPPSQRVQCVAYFRIDTLTSFATLTQRLEFFDGVNKLSAGIRMDVTNEILQSRSAGGWANITGSDIDINTGGWNRFAFTIDYQTSKYISADINHLRLDLSAVELVSSASAVAGKLDYFFGITNDGANQITAYIDDGILLQLP